ncbi:hypothetical protein [Streptomyces sp. NPDC088348]|uniref:hypothetical protein n=1 Tax=Streptomyces sp. NPDC088348 TaxID=3365853 RepID=UPI0037F56179
MKNPQPGYTITFFDDAEGSEDAVSASYKLKSPFPNDPTMRMTVDAGCQVSPGNEIVPGVRANGHSSLPELNSVNRVD